MKKIIFILLLVVSIVSFSQTSFQCTKTIDTSNCKLRFFNANSVKIFELNLATTTYTRGVTNEYIIKDGLTQVTITNNGCLTTPTFANLASFIDGARFACISGSVVFPTNLDTTQTDTVIDKHVLLDSTKVRVINDSLKVYFTQPLLVNNDTTHNYILSEINSTLTTINSRIDTTQTDTSLAPQIDYSIYFQKLVSIGYDTSQVDTSLINYIASFDTTINRLDSILASIKRQSSIDTTHTAILQQIQDTLISKLSLLDKSDIDTSLGQVIQLNQIIDSLSTLINKSNIDTTHTAILNDIKELIAKLDTSSIDTSLVPAIDYSDLFYALINKGYDTSQVDTALDKHILLDSTSVRIINDSIKVWFTQPLEVSKDTTHQTILSEIKELLTVINSRVDTTQQDTSLDKSIKLDSTLVRIINDTLNVRFIDSTYYTQLDSIKYFLSQSDSIEICFDTVTFQTYVTNLPTTICNGDSAVRVQLCNTDSTLNQIVRTKIDTTNAILYRIENKATKDTTHEYILRSINDSIHTLINSTIRNNDSLQLSQIIDSLTNLSAIINELKSDCIGSNETYYINGTNTVTLNASEVCSYTVTVIEEKLQYSENGVSSPFDLPVGYTGSNSFKNGSKFLINQVSFTGTTGNSKAIIKIIK